MSRIGRAPIEIPAGVEVTCNGTIVTVKGPKGTLTHNVHPDMTVTVEGNTIHVTRPSDDKLHRSLHGLTRTLIHNMVIGVTEGFSKTLEINGVGYRAAKEGQNLVMHLGFSHTVTVSENADIQIEVPNPNQVIIKGIDKEKVGQFAAEVRAKRPPEPYKGKGINTKAQRVRRHQRVRGKVSGTAERPRLSVFRSENNIYAQIIDDVAGKTLCSASTVEKGFEGNGGNCEAAAKIGKLVGERAVAAGITEVVFDRGGNVYHGRVKALAEGAREGGLKF